MSKKIKKFDTFDERQLLESCGGGISSCGGSSHDDGQAPRRERRAKLVRKLKAASECSKCGEGLKGSEKFCPECGEKI
jgi:ribosomal protein L32